MKKKISITEGVIQKAIDWFVAKKIEPMEKQPSSDWNQMKNLATKIKNNQTAVKKYMNVNKQLISDFAESLKNTKTLRMITNPEETERNLKRSDFLSYMDQKTGDWRYTHESLKYLPNSQEYLDYELNQNYEAYMNKFFQTKDTRYFEAALKHTTK